jgi:hypothetical protein
MALSDYGNLDWLFQGSDADWKKALAESKLIAQGKEALKSGSYTPTERMITNPLTGGLEFLNVDPRYARQTSAKLANVVGVAPVMGAEGGDVFGRAVANQDPLSMAGGLGLAALGTVGSAGKKGATTIEDIVKSIESKKVTEGLGQFKSTKPSEIYNKTMGGGYSVNVPTGDIPNEGLMMGIYKNTDPRNKVLDKLTKKDIEQQYLTNKKALDQTDNYFGTWLEPETNKTYLDVSKRFEPNDLRKAVKFGERTNQIAGYNVGKGESFPVGNWNDYIKSNELSNRLHEANKWGADYLAQHPTVNWWDLKGTPIADVYGLNENPEGLKRMAGFLAATSPVSDVPRNARIGSEYYRRWLANEPVRQPNFRMPENSVFETAGNMMPMESGRANNLKAAYEGRINDLRNEKVNNMGLALMGDPNAVVLDRHMAAVMEDPSKNIFTAAEKGIFPSGKPYADAKDIFIQQAQQANPPLSPRDFSANVWTGYRNKAQQEGNAFGQKTSGAGIQGESKSIADTMMDQVKIKAQKLGIPFEEMVKKLRSGEISLLSLMPVGLGGGLLGSDNNK